MVSSTASSMVWNFHNLITYHKFLFGGKTAWRASRHSLSMQSCPTGATPHDFLCGVAPVGQIGMEDISAFYTAKVLTFNADQKLMFDRTYSHVVLFAFKISA